MSRLLNYQRRKTKLQKGLMSVTLFTMLLLVGLFTADISVNELMIGNGKLRIFEMKDTKNGKFTFNLLNTQMSFNAKYLVKDIDSMVDWIKSRFH